ncbi:hypothetical protein YC2023_085675 [Brassica napus]
MDCTRRVLATRSKSHVKSRWGSLKQPVRVIVNRLFKSRSLQFKRSIKYALVYEKQKMRTVDEVELNSTP